jgi:hypothetical protein
MAVPKTTMDKNDVLAPAKNKVRVPRHALYVCAIATADLLQDSPHALFRTGVLVANKGHDFRPSLCSDQVQGVILRNYPSNRHDIAIDQTTSELIMK